MMAKKSRKRLGRYEKDQSGCMWSLINIFDFRQSRSSQKLLQDRKRGSKRVVGAAYPDITIESLSDSFEICKETNDAVQGGTSSTIDTSKMSVKELMDEEMCGEQDQKSIANGDAKQTPVGESHGKKNHRRTRSSYNFLMDKDKDLAAVNPGHRKHKSASSVDLNVMVEELCSQIHHNDVSCLKPIEDPCILEEKLWEATKVLVNHFTEGKSFPKDGKIQPSKELVDALQILDSNKQVFLKLLQDPNSQLVKNIRSLQDIQVEEGKFKVLTGYNLLKQDIGNGNKQQSLFWRRLKKSDTSQVLNRIVVLKPGPESPQSTGDNCQIERVSSTFSFFEFKRKLKHAMRKEQHNLSSVGMTSPSRDHFFIERVPKSCVGVKKVDKTGKLNDDKIDTALSPEQRVSNIYAEAKKHLAEIVGNIDVDVDTIGRQVPKSLGRILSYSGYSSPIVRSPRKEGEIRKDGEIRKEGEIRKDGVIRKEGEIRLSCDGKGRIDETDAHALEPRLSDGLPCERGVNKPTHELEVSTSIADAEVQKEGNLMEILFEPCPLQLVSTNEQNDSSSTSKYPENWQSTSLRQDVIYDENEPSSSTSASTLLCSMTEKNEDVDAMSDATSRPSPVSVLEPLFKEDVITPPAVKALTAVEPIQPRQIRFEEEISAPMEKVSYNRTRIEGDKYTIKFVKDVMQMSGLTWDELIKRSLFSDHLIDPSLLDEVDFLPDLLSCDFNLLFDLINKVLIELCRLNFSCTLSFAKPFFQPGLKGKDIFSEIWKEVDWYLKLEGHPRNLEHIVAEDLAKSKTWKDLQPDRECLGIHVQQAILEELVEDTILSCVADNLEKEFPVVSLDVGDESEISTEL